MTIYAAADLDEYNDLDEDAHLLATVRAGDTIAYGALYERHAAAARRLAYALARDESDAQDLVAETFAKVLATLHRGHGPRGAFRAYVLTSLRHVWASRARRERRLELTDDLTRYETGEPFNDPTLAALDRSYAARAFGKLPERWRLVLWHTEIEGGTPAQVAPLLGLTPGGVAVLAYRARERLRQMYLQEHINRVGRTPCHPATERLGRYVRGGLAGRAGAKVAEHLAGCPGCRRLHGELAELNARVLPPGTVLDGVDDGGPDCATGRAGAPGDGLDGGPDCAARRAGTVGDGLDTGQARPTGAT